MKKYYLLILAVILTAALFVFAACDSQQKDTEPTAEPTAAATATATAEPTATPTATPEPTPTPSPTPVPERGTYDLFAASGIGDPMTADADGLIMGNSWPNESGGRGPVWAGLLEYVSEGTEDSVREVIFTTLSNGEEGPALRFANDGEQTDGGYVGAGLYICGFALEPQTTYKFTVKAKITHSARVREGKSETELRDFWLYNICDAAEGYSNAVKVEPTGDWQTAEYIFTTNNNTDQLENNPIFTVLCDPASPFMFPGFEVLIESVTLYEVVPS